MLRLGTARDEIHPGDETSFLDLPTPDRTGQVPLRRRCVRCPCSRRGQDHRSVQRLSSEAPTPLPRAALTLPPSPPRKQRRRQQTGGPAYPPHSPAHPPARPHTRHSHHGDFHAHSFATTAVVQPAGLEPACWPACTRVTVGTATTPEKEGKRERGGREGWDLGGPVPGARRN